MDVLAKGLLGGTFVVIFALVGQAVTPKRLAGVFAAAPSVALGSLLIGVLLKGNRAAHDEAVGMLAGAAGFVGYCLVAPWLLRRLGAVAGAAVALTAWLAAAGAVYPVLPR